MKLEKRYSRPVVYGLLSEFAKDNLIGRYGRGIYVVDPTNKSYSSTKVEKKSSISLPPIVRDIESTLMMANIDFMITGFSVLTAFMHLMPRRMIHLVYVFPGYGEKATKILKDIELHAIFEPSNENEVNLALSLTEGDLIIIRERRDLSGRMGHIASVERALVDLYFETTRKKIPMLESEVGRMIRNAIAHGRIDVTHLTKLASRRGIDKELREILIFEEVFPSEGTGDTHLINRHARDVFATSER